jgi:hypothetical protein
MAMSCLAIIIGFFSAKQPIMVALLLDYVTILMEEMLWKTTPR